MGTGIICAPAADASHEVNKKIPIRRNALREVIKTRFSVFLTNFKPLGPGNRAILDTGAAHNTAGPNLSRSTNRSAAGKSEKNNEHQQPEQDVAHNRRPSPCGIVNRTTPISKQKMFLPAAGAAVGYQVSGLGSRKKIKKERRDFPRSFFNRSFLSISLYPIPYTRVPICPGWQSHQSQ